MVGPWCTVSAPPRGRCGWVLIPLMVAAELGWRLGPGVSPAWEPGIFTLARPAAPLPGPNPLLLLCSPFPLCTTQPPTSRRRGTPGGSFLPPTQPRTELHLHVLPAGCGGGGAGVVVQGASYPPLAPAPPLPQYPAPPHGPLPSPSFMKSQAVPSPQSISSENLGPSALLPPPATVSKPSPTWHGHRVYAVSAQGRTALGISPLQG